MEKLIDKQMRFVCELIWGNIPADKNYKMDREWIEKTPIFNQMAPEILERYPMLDKSFFFDPNNNLPIKSKSINEN